MNAREWFCLSLRVLGVWQFVNAASYGSMFVWMLITERQTFYAEFSGSVVYFLVTSSIGVFLLLFAPAISHRLYPTAETVRPLDGDALPSRLLVIGVRLMGVWLIAMFAHGMVVAFADPVVKALLRRQPWGDVLSSNTIYQAVSAGAYAMIGMVLLIGPMAIIAQLDRLRYVAERDAYAPAPLEDGTGQEEHA